MIIAKKATDLQSMYMKFWDSTVSSLEDWRKV